MAQRYPASSFETVMNLLEYFSFQNDVGGLTLSSDHVTSQEGDSPAGEANLTFGGIAFIMKNSPMIQLIEIFLDVSTGGMFTKDLVKFLDTEGTGASSSDRAAYARVYFEKLRDDGRQQRLGLMMPNLRHYSLAQNPNVSVTNLPESESTQEDDSAAMSQFILRGKRPKTLRGTILKNGSYSIVDDPGSTQTLDSVSISVSDITSYQRTYSPPETEAEAKAEYIARLCQYVVEVGIGVSSSQGNPDKYWFQSGSGESFRTHVVRINLSLEELGLTGPGLDPSGATLINKLRSELETMIVTQEEVDEMYAARAADTSLEDVTRYFGMRYIVNTWYDQNGDDLQRQLLDNLREDLEDTNLGGGYDPQLFLSSPLGRSQFKINGTPENPNRLFSPGLAVFDMPHLMFNPCMRHCAQAALFSAGVPTTEMSLCAPFINLSFYHNTPPLENVSSFLGGAHAKTRGNMISFLGTGKVSMGTADIHMANASLNYGSYSSGRSQNSLDHGSFESSGEGELGSGIAQDDTFLEVATQSRTGMELFTSPQTLVNMDINKEREASQYVLDPTQPFMSLESISVKEYASGFGLIGFKKATVNITLHDRSRLGEVSQFIAPASFGQVSALLEFGWSHPNGDLLSGSPYGKFLNTLRNTSKYRLIKGNYNMDASGQIKITLEMGTMGGEDSKVTNAFTGDFVHINEINSLLRDVTTEILRLTTNGPISEEIRDVQRLSSRDAGSQQMIERRVYDDLRHMLYEITSQSSLSESRIQEMLTRTLSLLEDVQPEDGTAAVHTTSPQELCSDVIRNLSPTSTQTDDPWITDLFPLAMSAAEADDQYTTIKEELSFATMSADGSYYDETNMALEDLQEVELAADDVAHQVASLQRQADIAYEDAIWAGATTEEAQAASDHVLLVEEVELAFEEAVAEEEVELTDEQRLELQNEEYLAANPVSPGYADWVSLGKIMTTMVANPLASTGRYDEVQLCFYNFNDSAGACQGMPMSVFPVRMSVFAQQLADALETNPNLTTSRLEAMLGRAINNSASQAYGFKDIHRNARTYRQEREASLDAALETKRAAEGDKVNLTRDEREAVTPRRFNLDEALVQRMASLGLYRPEFKIPRLKIIYETVPVVNYVDPADTDKTLSEGKIDPRKTILRIHVMDQNAQSHPGEQLVIDTLSAGSAVSLFSNFTAGGNSSVIGKAISDVLDTDMVSVSLETESASAGDSLRILAANTTRDAIHKYVKTKVPTIQVGTAFSPFESVSISGMSSGAVFNALLSETFRDNNDSSDQSSAGTGIEEVTVVPVTAKASGLGNPMFHYGQQFYLDLKTGTTADNIFTVRSVTHNLGPGKFTTDVDFAPAGTQGTVSAVRANLISALATLDKLGGGDSPLNSPVERAPLAELLVNDDVTDTAERIESLRKIRRSERQIARVERRNERRTLQIERAVDEEMGSGELGDLNRRIAEIEAAGTPDELVQEWIELTSQRSDILSDRSSMSSGGPYSTGSRTSGDDTGDGF